MEWLGVGCWMHGYHIIDVNPYRVHRCCKEDCPYGDASSSKVQSLLEALRLPGSIHRTGLR